MLQIEGLCKTYLNGVVALNKIHLTIGKGMFGLLGPNGAGKSSLMRTIATLQEADAGRVRFGEIEVLQQKDQMRQVLGYLPQEFGLYPNVSAESMLDHLALLKGIVNKRERKESIDYLLQATNLDQHRKKSLGGFSGGMKQRFGIAQALLGNPELIIVDEPTAGLDPVERERFLNLLGILSEDITIILSTHIVSDVAETCNDMAILHQGHILIQGSPIQLIENFRGKIWKATVSRTEADSITANIFTMRPLCGKVIVKAYSELPLSPPFATAEPLLEDVYFSIIKGFAHASV